MKIKCGRKEYDVHTGDEIMFNGYLYILMLPESPVISKALFKKLVKEGVVEKRGHFMSKTGCALLNCDRFVFVKEEFDI